MKIDFKPGFTIFKNNSGPTYVAPHAGIAFYDPKDEQDEGTHLIVFKLAKNGGRAIISLITRERNLGIDFCRQMPTKEVALENYELFKNGLTTENRKFRERYAWVAKNYSDHEFKKRVFNEFWKEIGNSEKAIVFIHRLFLIHEMHPSIIDIVSFNHKNRIKEITNSLNKKYEKIFKKIFPIYKKEFDSKINFLSLKQKIAEEFNLPISKERLNLQKEIKNFRDKVKRKSFIEITFEKCFHGKYVKRNVKSYLSGLKIPIIELEISEFLLTKFPELTICIISDLIKKLNVS